MAKKKKAVSGRSRDMLFMEFHVSPNAALLMALGLLVLALLILGSSKMMY